MSKHCVVIGCKNGDYRLLKWKREFCEIHPGFHHEKCPCEPPFTLKCFPGIKRKPEERKVWINLINRETVDRKRKWEPGVKARVCSNHFEQDFDYPIKNLGYESAGKKVRNLFPLRFIGEHRKSTATGESSRTGNLQKSIEEPPSLPLPGFFNEEESAVVETPVTEDITFTVSEPEETLQSLRYKILVEQEKNAALVQDNIDISAKYNRLLKEKSSLMQEKSLNFNKIKDLKEINTNLVIKKKRLRNIVIYLKKKVVKCNCSKPLNKKILKRKSDTTFYTGLPNLECFEQLHSLVSPLICRKWKGKYRPGIILRKYKKSPKKMGPKLKLLTKDELLMTLMKLRLGLSEKDLADRFQVSTSTVSSTIATWIKALSSILRHLIYMPSQGSLNFTRPKRFENNKDISAIIDATEVFLETPKNPDLQKITWSEYKHHNTVKILIACTPNSSISFVSKSYPGSISDKAIVRHSNYLDEVPMYTCVMADKGFNIEPECRAKNVRLYIPPGKRGTYQMLPSEITKTKRIANLRILIEQVIRQIKTFKILANEFPIRLLPKLDDIVIICSALCNFSPAIFPD